MSYLILHKGQIFSGPSHALYDEFQASTHQGAPLKLLARPSSGTGRRRGDLLKPEGVYVGKDHGVKTASLDPYANAPSDIRDALEHVQNEFDIPFDEELDPNDFEQHRTTVTLDEVYDYDDIAWLDTEPGELVGASREEVLEWAEAFRPPIYTHYTHSDYDFVQTVAKAYDSGVFPAIILVDTPQVKTLGDGRGRVNLAIALGVDELPAVILTPKESR